MSASEQPPAAAGGAQEAPTAQVPEAVGAAPAAAQAAPAAALMRPRRRDRRRVRLRGRGTRSGGSALGRRMSPGCADPDPAARPQPARTGRRRDRYRQDEDAPADRRAALGQRRAGLPRRHQGRRLRRLRPRRGRREGPGAGRPGRPGVAGDGLPLRVLRARRDGPRHPGARHGDEFRPRAAVEGAPAQPDAGAVARPDLPLRRLQGPGAGGSQGSPGGGGVPGLGHREGRAEGDRRALDGDGGGDPAVDHGLRAAGRGGVLR